ncbi:MAG: hypothetical protein DCF16_00220 [Alphaproteobacteria bacterium]|nr:MAG: hypothetical protein DCF16_00220 [Alphaproteobacteria bacterium]
MAAHRTGKRNWFQIGFGYLAPAIIGLVCIGWSETGTFLMGIDYVFAPSNWGRSLFWLCAMVVVQFVGLRIARTIRRSD